LGFLQLHVGQTANEEDLSHETSFAVRGPGGLAGAGLCRWVFPLARIRLCASHVCHPAFARKYQTACTTCHKNYPELNDFGEAFKKNGFKFPKDDETFVKEPPVMLGAKALKEAFPKAVYPGEIPGTIPIGFRYSGFATYSSKQPLAVGYLPRTDLFVPNTFTVIGAGSFGERPSFWVDNDISAGGADAAAGLGDGYIKINDIGHYMGLPKDLLNLRMGQFELDLPFTQARSIDLTNYDCKIGVGLGSRSRFPDPG
jgi:hypothetical protein